MGPHIHRQMSLIRKQKTEYLLRHPILVIHIFAIYRQPQVLADLLSCFLFLPWDVCASFLYSLLCNCYSNFKVDLRRISKIREQRIIWVLQGGGQ